MSKTIGLGGILMLLLLSLAAIGVGTALWSKILTIDGRVVTGDLDVIFGRVYTDDDDRVDSQARDSQDNDSCADFGIHPGSSPAIPIDTAPAPFPNKDGANNNKTSCDPAATGVDPKPHYTKDVARCDAMPDPQDNEHALIQITNGYPSYHCTVWFNLWNTGTIPAHLHGLLLNDARVRPCESGGRTELDLSGDGEADISACLSSFFDPPPGGEGDPVKQQCEPFSPSIPEQQSICSFDLDLHVLQEAPQGASLGFDAQVCVHQFNEDPPAGTFCGHNPEHAPPN